MRHVLVGVINRPGCIVASFRGLAKPLLPVVSHCTRYEAERKGLVVTAAQGCADPQPPSNHQPSTADRQPGRHGGAKVCKETLVLIVGLPAPRIPSFLDRLGMPVPLRIA